jgi:hypothetical protein
MHRCPVAVWAEWITRRWPSSLSGLTTVVNEEGEEAV